jgi:hypothetical protein
MEQSEYLKKLREAPEYLRNIILSGFHVLTRNDVESLKLDLRDMHFSDFSRSQVTQGTKILVLILHAKDTAANQQEILPIGLLCSVIFCGPTWYSCDVVDTEFSAAHMKGCRNVDITAENLFVIEHAEQIN